MSIATITECRVCGEEALISILQLGEHPLANALKKAPDEPEARYPLTLMFCSRCSLVQIRETVDKGVLFNQYVWVTGTSSTARRFAYEFYEKVQRVKPLQPGDSILEIASNDGTFLIPFIDHGFRAVGVDPAGNIAEMANANGIRTLCAFWDEEVARDFVSEFGSAKLIVARNVIAHVSELHGVVAGLKRALDDDGVGAVEFHAAAKILDQLQYDSIYHEHLCYFSLTSFERLLSLHDLHPFHVDLSPISGGAYVVYFAAKPRVPSPAYRTLDDAERRLGIHQPASWQAFATRCRQHRERSLQMAERFRGRTVVGFGASARSATYLNFCQFTNAEIAAVIDNNALKWGLYTPGSSIPILSPNDGFCMHPDLIFIFAWNFRDEIIETCRNRGYDGEFLIAFPHQPRLVKDTRRHPL